MLEASIKLEEVDKFESKLMKHGKVLTLKPKGDLADSFFLNKGHDVEHLKMGNNRHNEVYEEIVKEKVIKLMNGLKEKERFIGIWALDTLFHLDRLDIYYVLNKFYQILVEKGLVYLSLRCGEEDFLENGEWHTCFTKSGIIDLIGFTDFSIVEIENKKDHIDLILKK
ncbi:hypothetical protein [Cetobacterium sp.]|uniref:hypothetical protein n=1 Tax=Cetobacterium sp. TaxID=2071632 RepID=UPI003F34A57C